MALTIGTQLGLYEITALLGKGGMGEVYRARDLKLKRDVAIKVLPEEFSREADRVSRFRREAEVLASLNHPNIAQVYGLEESGTAPCIVMELVEGDTLADRLKRGPLSEAEALRIAKELAHALEVAHEKGIVHRDLKPANVKLTPEQKVKVLDFGLAKVREAEASGQSMSNSPTMMSGASLPGVILGTVAYMSPEQARGKTVDKRTDIWAFGCVLFEMLSGRELFGGETVSDTVARILERQPDWQALPTAVSSATRNLLRRCLEKEPGRRLHDIADVRIEIEDVLNGDPRSIAIAAPPPTSRWTPIRWPAAIAVAIVIGSLLIARSLGNNTSPDVTGVKRFAINFPLGAVINDAVLSPDGRQLVYVLAREHSQVGRGERSQLYHRKLDEFDAHPIAGTEGATFPFFSPDGRWVGFFADGKIKKVTLSGGVPVVVCDARGLAIGASWTDTDAIVFSPDVAGGLMQVSAEGGEPKPLTTPARGKGEIGHFFPSALPGGKGIVFNVVSLDGIHVAVLPRNSSEWRRLVPGRRPQYAASGHLLFTQADRLFAAPFDAEKMELSGAPVPAIDGVGNDVLYGEPNVPFSVSSNGSLAYVPNTVGKMKLAWVDRTGKATPVGDETAYEFSYPRLSPDGRSLAVTDDAQIWTYDLLRGTRSRLTSGSFNFVPAWSADGKQVAFGSYVAGSVDILSRPADMSAPATTLLGGANRRYPASWAVDGTLVFQEAGSEKGSDIRMMNGSGKSLTDIAASSAEERSARLSPDGEWVAYSSNETGRFEVYVRQVRRPGGAITVSTKGGGDPLWSPDGRELFYAEGNNLMAVAIRTKPSFEASAPKPLFTGKFQSANAAGTAFDIAPDGQRFLMAVFSEVDRPMQINFVLDWFTELRQRVPVK